MLYNGSLVGISSPFERGPFFAGFLKPSSPIREPFLLRNPYSFFHLGPAPRNDPPPPRNFPQSCVSSLPSESSPGSVFLLRGPGASGSFSLGCSHVCSFSPIKRDTGVPFSRLLGSDGFLRSFFDSCRDLTQNFPPTPFFFFIPKDGTRLLIAGIKPTFP